MFINILVFFVMIIDKIIDIVYNQYIQYYNFALCDIATAFCNFIRIPLENAPQRFLVGSENLVK